MNSKNTVGDITGKFRKLEEHVANTQKHIGVALKPVSEQTLVERLRNRAAIRRNIPRAKEG